MSNSNLKNTKNVALISLGIEDRSEESVKLVLEAFEDSFCMRGEAFFSTRELEKFLFDLRKFPIAEYDYPSLSGGHFDDKGECILTENLHMSVSQFNKLGLLAFRVRAFTPHPSIADQNIGFGGQCAYFFGYESLNKFCDEFQLLISNDRSFFEFKEFAYI